MLVAESRGEDSIHGLPMLRWLTLSLLLFASGCGLIPKRFVVPVVHNPFPQLQKVAIVPFFNQSDQPTVDGRMFALAYFDELQRIPGFVVTPIGVTEVALQRYRTQLNDLSSPEDVRRLAELLNVDAVVIGAVTDFSPYYPPRCALRVEWYAANPYLHPAPPGFGLPWGTCDEENISASIRFDAEMAMSREFLEANMPAPPAAAVQGEGGAGNASVPETMKTEVESESIEIEEQIPGKPISHESAVNTRTASAGGKTATTDSEMAITTVDGGILGADGLPIPSPSNDPVLSHTRIYNGNSGEFTIKLKNYMAFRDERRSGGVAGYLQRMDDFVRFCCFLHLTEMLEARGGGDESRVVYMHLPDR